jgi:hypothetical protein
MIASAGHSHRRTGGVFELFVNANRLSFSRRQE